MPDFSIVDLLDEAACIAWLERCFHPKGLMCPHCGSASQRLFRQQGAFPAYRCLDCDGYYTLLTGTVFVKTRQRPAALVLLLRGIAKGESAAAMARELGMSRGQVLSIRQRVQAQQTKTVTTNELHQSAGARAQHRDLTALLRRSLKRRFS